MELRHSEADFEQCLQAARGAQRATHPRRSSIRRPVQLLGWGLPDGELEALKEACNARGISQVHLYSNPEALPKDGYGPLPMRVHLVDLSHPGNYLRGDDSSQYPDLFIGWFTSPAVEREEALGLRKRLNRLQMQGLDRILHVSRSIGPEERRRAIAAAVYFFSADGDDWEQARNLLKDFKGSSSDPLKGDDYPYRYAWLSLSSTLLYETAALRALYTELQLPEQAQPDTWRLRDCIQDFSETLFPWGQEVKLIRSGLCWLPRLRMADRGVLKRLRGRMGKDADGSPEKRLYGGGHNSPSALQQYIWLNSPYKDMGEKLTPETIEELGTAIYAVSRCADPLAGRLRLEALEKLAEDWGEEARNAENVSGDTEKQLQGYAKGSRYRMLRTLTLAGREWLEQNQEELRDRDLTVTYDLQTRIREQLRDNNPASLSCDWRSPEKLLRALRELLADETSAWKFLDKSFIRWAMETPGDVTPADMAFSTVQILAQGGIRQLWSREEAEGSHKRLRIILPEAGMDAGEGECLTLRLHSHSWFILPYFLAEEAEELETTV